MKKNDIGIFGLGVMGQNLALNFSNKDFFVSVFNRTSHGEEKILEEFISKKAKNTKINGFKNIEDFIKSLEKPRKIILMVKAGKPVDWVIDKITPLLEKNDIIIDGGNSHFKDTLVRLEKLKKCGIRYVGCGISGGSSGALNGPSMMTGGDQTAWEDIKSLFQKVSAKYNHESCCQWMGKDGAGHFVKMVHNGIEYALMQMIAESYDIQKKILKMSNTEISRNMQQWNETELKSFLMHISSKVLVLKDDEDTFVIDDILDCSSQKGTGKDISISALELGVPLSTINEAVNVRYLSSIKNLRKKFSEVFEEEKVSMNYNKEEILLLLKDALYCSQVIAYSQGLMMIQEASTEFGFNIDLNNVIRTWRRGCIIESSILEELLEIECNDIPNILLDLNIEEKIKLKKENWRKIVVLCIENALPASSITSALCFFDSICSLNMPANLIQAQRDYFGYHGFEKVNSPRGEIYHLEVNHENI